MRTTNTQERDLRAQAHELHLSQQRERNVQNAFESLQRVSAECSFAVLTQLWGGGLSERLSFLHLYFGIVKTFPALLFVNQHRANRNVRTFGRT